MILGSQYVRSHRHGPSVNFGKKPLLQVRSLFQMRNVSLLRHCDPLFSLICSSLTPIYRITGSLRLIQHVGTVQAPLLWEDIETKTWRDVSWAVKQFQVHVISFSDLHSYIFCDIVLVLLIISCNLT